MTPPTFIMSLDCEGKWGMADMLQPYHHQLITNASLAKAYRQLIDMLGRHDIAATFAFVMAFALSDAERRKFPVLNEKDNRGDPWLAHYWRCRKDGQGDGWHQPEAFDIVCEAGVHEIASHSFCHRPLGDRSVDPAGASAELALAQEAASVKGVDLKTLVFPRNEVGNLPAVRAAGYLGYRERLARPEGRLGRAIALAEEFSVAASPQEPVADRCGLVAIPPGRFFNWRHGTRRLVPPALTTARWKSQLDRCTRDGGVVHLWLHPHNLITGPETAPVLENVLAEVARLRDAGRLRVMTQRDYCERASA